MDWIGWAVTIATALIGTGGWAAFLRVRSQNRLDSANSTKSEADAAESLGRTVSALSQRLSAVESESRARLEQVESQLQADIDAKDIRIGHLESHVARLNAESLEREKKYNALQSFTEGVIQAFAILDGQLRAHHIVPAAQLPPKPPTGPLKP